MSDMRSTEKTPVTAPHGFNVDERWAYANKVEKEGSYVLERAYCEASIEWFADHWVNTYDPKGVEKVIPFNLFPKQREFLRWLAMHERQAVETRHDQEVIVEKSREMGATWLCCLYAIHGWLFRPGYSVGFGSRILELVDTIGDPDSIFEKLRMLIRGLPLWLWPRRFSFQKHSAEGKLINPTNDATIRGEGGDGIGRGGRTGVYFIDEAAFIPHPDLVDSSLLSNALLRVNVSTPNGLGNSFARKRFSFAHERIFTLKWTDDPRKDAAWYQHMRDTYDEVTVASNIDIDYTASVQGITIPAAWVRSAINLPLEESAQKSAGLDVADEGDNESVFIWRAGPVVKDPIAWNHLDTTQTSYKARDHAEKNGVSVVYYDVGGVGSGVKGVWNNMETKLSFEVVAVQAGSSPSESIWPEANNRKAKELFARLRDEMWWTLRRRFEKTHERVTQGVAHPDDECISIPNCHQLIAQLSMPLHKRLNNGKIQVESKPDMRKRGVRSPDYADALCLAFYPVRKKVFNWF